MTDNIRFLAVARIPDQTVVATYVANDASREVPRALMEEKVRVVLASGRTSDHRRLTITDKDCGSIHYDSDAACLYLSAFPLLQRMHSLPDP